MKFHVHKETIDGIDRLPDITATEIWQYYDTLNPKKNDVLIARLYMAVMKRENYYQDYTPTAFGDPNYTLNCGIVIGIETAANISEEARDGRIVFRKGNRIILEVDKVNKPKSYYEANREIREIMDSL